MSTTSALRAFHNDSAIKTKYQERLREHRRLEHLVQGTGWEVSGEYIKGCAIGCTLEKYDHDLYPVELGLPRWVAALEDHLFEHLPKGRAEQFAEDLLEAIPVGADVEPVRNQLAIARLERSLAVLESNKNPYADKCRCALNLFKAYHQTEYDESGFWADARRTAGDARKDAIIAREAAFGDDRVAAQYAEHAVRNALFAGSDDYEWEASTLLALLRESKPRIPNTSS